MQKLLQTRSSILQSITDKTKQEVEKHSCKNNARSQRGVTWQTDAIGLRKSGPGLLSHFLSPRQLQQL
jgi:hypothetical protein